MYYCGNGVDLNYLTAIKSYRTGVEKGYAYAQ